MKTVIIDNYDSFTYNLSHLVKELGAEVTVLRNDQFELPCLEEYDNIILSPGLSFASFKVLRDYVLDTDHFPLVATIVLPEAKK